jgi:hypothetical protein
MEQPMKQLSRHKNTIGLLAGCLFCFLYLWIWVNPSLYLIRGYREFFADSYFLWDFMGFPGYPAEYAARFLTQLYLFPFVASLLIAAMLFSVYKLMASCLSNRWIALIPAVVLLLMHNDYRHSIKFDLDTGVVCLFLCLFISSLRYRRVGAVSFPLLLAAALYLNGIWAAMLFAGMAFILCFVRKEKGIRFIEILIGVLIVCLVFHYLFYLSWHDLYQEYVDISRIYAFPYYPFILYLSMIGLPLLCYIPQSMSMKGIKAKPLYTIPGALLLFLALFFTSDIDERRGLSVQHHALNRQWDKALAFAQRCEYPDKDVVLYTNQALYFTGKLHDDLFLYNQSFGSEGLLATEITNYSAIVPNQDVFLHLGALSLSIIWGTEATNVYGANPYVLKNLVKAYLAGGYIIEADKILNQLERGLFNKEWVKQYRTFTANPALINQDTELSAYRQSQAPLAIVATQNTLMNLYLLMKDTKANRMAYDYLLTASLLDHKIEYFASYLTGLKEYGYTTIPKLYFEGLVYNSLYSPQSPINIREYSFDPNTIYRFNAFQTDLRTALKTPKTAPKTLEEQYKDTYWYYLLFRSKLPDEEKVEILNRLITPSTPPQPTPQPPKGGVERKREK